MSSTHPDHGPASTAPSDGEEDDECPICYRLLYRPYRTRPCGHVFCYDCLLASTSTSKLKPPPQTSTPVPTLLTLPEQLLSCPKCRTSCRAESDTALATSLESKNPFHYGAQVALGSTQNMILCIGNTHRKVKPTISPLSGKLREHHWTFFLLSSHPEIIDCVDILLHPSYGKHRFISLRKPPFCTSHLGWGTFTVDVYVTMKEGWEWVDGEATHSAGRNGDRAPKGVRRDRVAFEHVLGFKDDGKQEFQLVEFREMEREDDFIISVAALFDEDGA